MGEGMVANLFTLLVALVGGGFLGSVVQGILQRRKLGADYADVIARSATGLLKPLSDRVDELTAQLTAEQAKAKKLTQDLDKALESLNQARIAIRVMRNELEQLRGDDHRRGT